MPSLIIETATTNTNGAMAVAGLSGDIIDMDWMIAIIRKYTLASLLNWLNRQSGRYDHLVYLVVLM
jgi:hypothetical protein